MRAFILVAALWPTFAFAHLDSVIHQLEMQYGFDCQASRSSATCKGAGERGTSLKVTVSDESDGITTKLKAQGATDVSDVYGKVEEVLGLSVAYAIGQENFSGSCSEWIPPRFSMNGVSTYYLPCQGGKVKAVVMAPLYNGEPINTPFVSRFVIMPQ